MGIKDNLKDSMDHGCMCDMVSCLVSIVQGFVAVVIFSIFSLGLLVPTEHDLNSTAHLSIVA